MRRPKKTAVEIKTAADTANTALSFVAGGQAALGVFKAAQTIRTTAKMYQAGTLGYRTADYILRTQGKNIVQGVINGGFSIGDGVMGILTNPTVSNAFGPDAQANLNTAKTIWSGLSIAKGLTFDGYCLLTIKDAFTGQGKVIISNLTDFTKTTVDTTGHVISILQNNNGEVVQAVQRPEVPLGEAVKNDLVYQRITPETMLPKGSYETRDENDVASSFTVTASSSATMLPNLKDDDRLIDASGDIKALEPPPYEHYCGWEVDFSNLEVIDLGDLLYYRNTAKQKHGPFYQWLDNSRAELYISQCYYEDLRHGSYTSWHGAYAGGIKAFQYYYNMDVLHGPYTKWHDNGVKALAGTYESGYMNGLWTVWRETGVKEYEGNYSGDKQDGLWTWWFENGNKRLEEQYVLGKNHGSYTRGHDDGTLEREGQFTDGTASGIWTYYNQDGSCWYRWETRTP